MKNLLLKRYNCIFGCRLLCVTSKFANSFLIYKLLVSYDKNLNLQLLGRLLLALKKAVVVKVIAMSNVHQVMQRIIEMARMVSISPSRNKNGILINQ